MERDLRQTALYREIEAHFHAALAPAFGRISGAGDAAPSPDGQVIAVTGSRLNGLEGVPETRICLAALPAGPLEEITFGPHDDLKPRWSPDGTGTPVCAALPGPTSALNIDHSYDGDAAADRIDRYTVHRSCGGAEQSRKGRP